MVKALSSPTGVKTLSAQSTPERPYYICRPVCSAVEKYAGASTQLQQPTVYEADSKHARVCHSYLVSHELIITTTKPVVTGQTPITLEWNNTSEKN